MRSIALLTSLVIAGFAAASFAPPAEAKKRRAAQPVDQYTNQQYMAGKYPPNMRDPTGVYMADGEEVGKDPDPHIRLMMTRDPKGSWGTR